MTTQAQTFLERRLQQGAEEIAAFRQALEAKNGMANHPKRDGFWRLAWDSGHANGYDEVELQYEILLSELR